LPSSKRRQAYPKIGISPIQSQPRRNRNRRARFTPQHTMTTAKIDHVSVTTQANVYFDGKCVSHGITLADGTKKSVGVILPSTLTFNTGAPEIMECVGGACEYKLAGTDAWVLSSDGEQFSVPGNATFEIRVAEGHAAYHYICHFG
jgi:uncharacterized protein YaiE (UPF0345 family)